MENILCLYERPAINMCLYESPAINSVSELKPQSWIFTNKGVYTYVPHTANGRQNPENPCKFDCIHAIGKI